MGVGLALPGALGALLGLGQPTKEDGAAAGGAACNEANTTLESQAPSTGHSHDPLQPASSRALTCSCSRGGSWMMGSPSIVDDLVRRSITPCRGERGGRGGMGGQA